jgi:hypothetical protein
MARLLAAALLALLLCAAPSAAQGASSWALVIGIDRCDSSEITPLRFAVADARDMARTLHEACGFPKDHVILLTSDGREHPSSVNVLRLLEGLASTVPSGGTFVFYFSGHALEDHGEGFLVTTDTALSSIPLLRKTALGIPEVEAAVRRIPAGRVIQIVDACRSDPRAGRGAGDNPLTAAMSRDLVLRRTSHGDSDFTATLFACQPGQRSYEGLEGHGFFTFHLIKALRGAAANASGEVTLGGLESYLERTVPESVTLRESGRVQIPCAQFVGHGGPSWTLARADVGSGYAVRIGFPGSGYRSGSRSVHLVGLVAGPDRPAGVAVSVNGRPLVVASEWVQTSARGATFNIPIPLAVGENRVAVKTWDASGRRGESETLIYCTGGGDSQR